MALRLFEKWQGQSLGGIIAESRELVEDDNFSTVKRCRESGEKILGRFQVYFPRNIYLLFAKQRMVGDPV